MRRLIGLLVTWAVVASCGPFSGDRDAEKSDKFPEGAPKTGCVQGVLVDGRTGARLPVETKTKADGIFALVLGEFKKAKAVDPKGKNPNLVGEYLLCGLPLENDYPIVARYAGFQEFQGTVKVDSTVAARTASGRRDLRSKDPTVIGNVAVFPSDQLAADFTVAVHHNGAALAGAVVHLKPNGTGFGPLGAGFLVPKGPRYQPLHATTDAAGLAVFPKAELVLGGGYGYTVIPPDGGSGVKSAKGNVTVGFSEVSGSDPYKLYVELPLVEIQLAIESSSLSGNDYSTDGSITYYFNRDIELVPGTGDLPTATLTDAVAATIKANTPGNDKSEQVTLTIQGNKLTIKPVFDVQPDVKKEPGVKVTYAGISVRPKAGQKRSQILAISSTVSIFGGKPIKRVPATLTLVSGNEQVGDAFDTLPDPIVVSLKDQFGDNLPNEMVSFTVTGGGGMVTPAAATTDMNGEAQTTWMLGGAGDQTAGLERGVHQLGSGPNARLRVTYKRAEP